MSLAVFDLLELDGDDVRRRPLLERKARLGKLIAKVSDGIEFVEHIEGDGADIFQAACKLGHEGIVAKRKDLPYEGGRSRRWLKLKNPDSPGRETDRGGGVLKGERRDPPAKCGARDSTAANFAFNGPRSKDPSSTAGFGCQLRLGSSRVMPAHCS